MLVLTSVIVFVAWRASINVAAICPPGISTPTSPTQSTATTAPPLYLGLDAYRHWDKLSYLELGDRVDGQSTADPAGSAAPSARSGRSVRSPTRALGGCDPPGPPGPFGL